MVRAVHECLARGERVLVFCRSVQSARFVDHALAEQNVHGVCSLHGQLAPLARAAAIRRIEEAGVVNARIRHRRRSELAAKGDRETDIDVVVTTDLMARGLDFSQTRPITVLQFDFPITASDYLHRAGRTGRAGAPGRVVSLVDRRDSDFAAQIEKALKSNQPLDRVKTRASGGVNELGF